MSAAKPYPKVLVTGGAGYIGSHIVWQLIDAGIKVVVLDNLYSGHQWAVAKGADFINADVADAEVLKKIMQSGDIGTVIHCAAHVVVPESVAKPLKYYNNNVVGMLRLLAACLEFGVKQFVFSSSAAVYGIPAHSPVDELAPCMPINPYGATKFINEMMLKDTATADPGFRFVALRYFNVAGAREDARLGQATPEATHLIKTACEVACGKRDKMIIYGDDYATADGTCVRDYIHVEDLAAAHLAALNYLDGGGDSVKLNCGYGRGLSVREVVACVAGVSGKDFAVEVAPRRAGDPPQLVATADAIRKLFGWQPRLDDLQTICSTAYRWEQKLNKKC